MKDVFLLGAGFSKSMFSQMPLLNDLTEELARHDEVRKWLHLGNLEDIMSYLGQAFPWEDRSEALIKKADFYTISKLIGLEILEKQRRNPITFNFPSHPMAPLFRKWSEYKSQVITLNYDSIVEDGMKWISPSTESIFPIPLASAESRDGTGFFAGYPTDEGAKLYKLHGSVTWYYSGREDFFGEQIYVSSLSSKAEEFNRSVIDKVPLIIPPTYNKATFANNEGIQSMWREARVAITRSERLIVIGYSLPESDLMMKYLLKASFNETNKKKILIVDKTREVFEKFKNNFGETCDVSFYETNSSNPAEDFAKDYE